MYTKIPEVRIETYLDLCRKGRYRVDMTAELELEIDGIDAALQRLDYHIIDADQRGQSYAHNNDPKRTVELDEIECQDSYVKLVLRNDDLDEAEIPEAKDYLSSLFDRIYQLSHDYYQENDCSYAYPCTYPGKY